jgi:hypothetical protein
VGNGDNIFPISLIFKTNFDDIESVYDNLGNDWNCVITFDSLRFVSFSSDVKDLKIIFGTELISTKEVSNKIIEINIADKVSAYKKIEIGSTDNGIPIFKHKLIYAYPGFRMYNAQYKEKNSWKDEKFQIKNSKQELVTFSTAGGLVSNV